MVADRFCNSHGASSRSSNASSPTEGKGHYGNVDRRRDSAQNPDQVGFAINPRRWVVERFFAWIGRNRRLAKDFEATINSARDFLYAASVMLLVRRIACAS